MLSNPYPLGANQIAEFQQNGHIYLPNILSKEVLEPYRQAIRTWSSEFQAKQKPLAERDTYGKAFLQLFNLWRENALVKELVFSKRFPNRSSRLWFFYFDTICFSYSSKDFIN